MSARGGCLIAKKNYNQLDYERLFLYVPRYNPYLTVN